MRTIAQHDGANDHLCYSENLTGKLQQIREKWNKYKDIQDEAKLLWYMIHRNTKPNRPKIDGNETKENVELFFEFIFRMS